MKLSPLTFYILAAICQAAGSSGAAMLAPFFMKAHGYSVALAGIPLVANGVGRICSDVLSGIVATYFSPGPLLIIAMAVGLGTSIAGYAFIDIMPIFVTAWILFGLTEAMFALSLRKIGFDQAAPGRQGRVQGQMASALGIGFAFGPLLGGFVGKWLGPDGLFFLYAVPQSIGMLLMFYAGAHRYRRSDRHHAPNLWREGPVLLRRLPFLAHCGQSMFTTETILHCRVFRTLCRLPMGARHGHEDLSRGPCGSTKQQWLTRTRSLRWVGSMTL